MTVLSYAFMDELMNENDKIFYQHMGQRVAKLRKELDITQVQMAEILGISQQHVASYECGRRKIPASMLPKLSKILGVPVEDILGMKKSNTKRGPTPALNNQIDKIRLLPRTKQKFVMDMLDTVIRQQK